MRRWFSCRGCCDQQNSGLVLWTSVAVAIASALLVSLDAFGETLIVSNRADETFQYWDTETQEELGTVKVGVGAHEFVVSPDGRTLVGSCYGSGPRHSKPDRRLVVVDLERPNEEPRMIDLGDHPRPNDMRYMADGETLVVTSEVRQCLLIVDVPSGAVIREVKFDEPAGHMMAMSPDGAEAYVPCVSSGKVMIVNLDAARTDAPVGIDTKLGAEGVDLSPDGRWLWVASNLTNWISVIDTESRSVVQEFEAPGSPFRVRFLPDGASVAVAHPISHELRIYDTETYELRHAVPMQQGLPTCLAVSADGDMVYAVCGQTQRIGAVNVEAGKVEHWYETGRTPDAVAITPLDVVFGE